MRFGAVPIERAEGAVLAHTLAVAGKRLRKGRTLGASDLTLMRDAGLREVIVARLDTDDLAEDAAAAMIARAMVPDPSAASLRLTDASTGRVNVYARLPGVLKLEADRINAANRIDPSVTIATLPRLARVRTRGMVATVKIISYGVARVSVERAMEALRDSMRIQPVSVKDAVLIQTDTGAGPGKGESAVQSRLDTLGVRLNEVLTVPHRMMPLAKAIESSKAEMVLILTASATSDPNDVAPEAVRAAGGTVTRFGMPVDPGNLLFIGHQGGRPVIGLPGCARSPALNGADWVLERVSCGLDVSDADIAAMGVGGLLKESPARPYPRERSRQSD